MNVHLRQALACGLAALLATTAADVFSQEGRRDDDGANPRRNAETEPRPNADNRRSREEEPVRRNPEEQGERRTDRRTSTRTVNRFTTILKSNVLLEDETNVGRIVDFVLSDRGCVEYLVVEDDDEMYVVPFAAAQVDFRGRTVQLSVSPQKFRSVTRFTSDRWPDLRDEAFQKRQFQFWGVTSFRPAGQTFEERTTNRPETGTGTQPRPDTDTDDRNPNSPRPRPDRPGSTPDTDPAPRPGTNPRPGSNPDQPGTAPREGADPAPRPRTTPRPNPNPPNSPRPGTTPAPEPKPTPRASGSP